MADHSPTTNPPAGMDLVQPHLRSVPVLIEVGLLDRDAVVAVEIGGLGDVHRTGCAWQPFGNSDPQPTPAHTIVALLAEVPLDNGCACLSLDRPLTVGEDLDERLPPVAVTSGELDAIDWLLTTDLPGFHAGGDTLAARVAAVVHKVEFLATVRHVSARTHPPYPGRLGGAFAARANHLADIEDALRRHHAWPMQAAHHVLRSAQLVLDVRRGISYGEEAHTQLRDILAGTDLGVTAEDCQQVRLGLADSTEVQQRLNLGPEVWCETRTVAGLAPPLAWATHLAQSPHVTAPTLFKVPAVLAMGADGWHSSRVLCPDDGYTADQVRLARTLAPEVSEIGNVLAALAAADL